MRAKRILPGIFLVLALAGVSPLRAFEAKSIVFTDHVPAQVLGLIVLHVGGIGASLLLTQPDTLNTGNDTFEIYDTFYQRGVGKKQSKMTGQSIGWGKILRPWLAGSVRGSLLRVDNVEGVNEGLTLEGGIQLRLLRMKRFTLYYDCGVGVCLTSEELPSGGTRFNIVSSAGLGALLNVQPGVDWQVGFRHLHISNGGIIVGDERNPGFDTNGVFSGLLIRY